MNKYTTCYCFDVDTDKHIRREKHLEQQQGYPSNPAGGAQSESGDLLLTVAGPVTSSLSKTEWAVYLALRT